jgi:O-antigen ligase
MNRTVRNSDGNIECLYFFLTIFGYWSTAPIASILFNAISIDDALYGPAFRVGLILFSLFVFFRNFQSILRIVFLFPIFIFTIFYFYRAYDSYFISRHVVNIDPQVVFLFLASTLVFGVTATTLNRALVADDRLFFRHAVVISVIFLIGLSFNFDQLFVVTQSQASLARVNSIGLSVIASSFLLLFLVMFPVLAARQKAIALALIAAFTFVLMLSKSRGPLVGLAASLLFLLLFAPIRSRMIYLGLLLIGFAGTLLLEYFFGYSIVSEITIKFFAEMDGTAGDSATMRLVAWRAAWDQFMEHPLFGRYLVESAYNFYPHNIILEAMMATGVVGTLFLLAHLGITLRFCARSIGSTMATKAELFVALLFVKELTQAMFSGAIWGAAGVYVTSFCLIGIHCVAHRNRRRAATGGGVAAGYR